MQKYSENLLENMNIFEKEIIIDNKLIILEQRERINEKNIFIIIDDGKSKTNEQFSRTHGDQFSFTL